MLDNKHTLDIELVLLGDTQMDMSNVMRHLQRKYKQHLACNSEFTRNYYDAMVIVHRLMIGK
jgi:hypothetical protein